MKNLDCKVCTTSLEKTSINSSPARKFLSACLISSVAFFSLACEKTPDSLAEPVPVTDANARIASGMTGINIVLNTPVTDAILADLSKQGAVLNTFPEIQAIRIRATADKLPAIQKLPYVAGASLDAERNAVPTNAMQAEDFSEGRSTWNLDAVNVTNLGAGRVVTQDGNGVYVGVLDTGLSDDWRQFFPEERIATQYAASFGGGGMDMGRVSEQPNKWEHDQNSHGTHVTSTIIGFKLGSAHFNGVAPKAIIIPVKVLNQNGSGWSSVIAQGIMHITELKKGVLKDHPVVINMSLGGSVLDVIEQEAIDYAIKSGVIIVASAGNSGMAGMGYPGAYAPVISVASAGLKAEFTVPRWWNSLDVAEPTNPADLYISGFSSRAKENQDLDVTAPGSNVVGPYQVNSGQLGYYYLSGTSMASPHVAGIVALMVQKNNKLSAPQAETILEDNAIPMADAVSAGSGFITADAALSGTGTGI